ncbi:hypothetical protein JP0128_05290 [Helicobacter pylori]|nr:hypothetical protein [Helicobacter pylori]GHS50409.1 hypothetical protein JP0128_05290 [Helicobacter pylori]
MPENDKSQHNPKYCELEHLLEKMAKESENKAFYTSFRQHYDTLLDEAFEETYQNQTPIRIEQKTHQMLATTLHHAFYLFEERFYFLRDGRFKSH